jgi:DNA-binding NarL/FixJ family response regulator
MPLRSLIQRGASSTSNPPKDRIRILCVDDSPLVLQALQRVVDRNPRFEWVGSLERADDLVEAAKRLCPHVVILDLYMPGADSLDELKRINSECPSARVLVLSSDSMQRTVQEAVKQGAWGFLSKYEPYAVLEQAILAIARGEAFFGPLTRP